jgi:hypothetical protein
MIKTEQTGSEINATKVKPEITVIPALSRDPEGAGLRGPTYRLGGRNDG